MGDDQNPCHDRKANRCETDCIRAVYGHCALMRTASLRWGMTACGVR
ncbi:hypothetical protein L665_02534 [Ralstonia solanacearum SD54]|nr:hypothetical protein L665_02534 [Ralstonia solanacearum SD54]